MSEKKNEPLQKDNDFVTLWREGRKSWNKWVQDHPSHDISFAGFDFCSEVNKEGIICFSGYQFGDGDVDFSGAKFPDCSVFFYRTNFGKGKLDFSNASFGKGRVVFDESICGPGTLNFIRAGLGESILSFEQTILDDCEVSFNQMRVNELFFRPRALSCNTLQARGLAASGATVIKVPKGSTVSKSCDINGASFKGPFLLSGEFSIVPDLRSTQLSHQVELSNLNVKLRRVVLTTILNKKLCTVAKDLEDAPRLRRLKDIAESTKDHQAALRFSADENRARRWVETSYPGSLLDLAFSAFSDYGQNIFRPFTSLFSLTFVSIGLYKVFASDKALTWENSWGHAATLSASNSLPFLPQSRGIRDDAIEALYSNDPSLLVDAIMIGQGALSFIFLFLIGLGLRNRFRL